MLAGSPEKNRHGKRDDCSEANPPRKFHHGQPAGLRVEVRPNYPGDVVRQTAQDRHDQETDNHGDNVAAIVPARLG